MLAILSPAVVLCACLGVAAMWQRRLRWEAAAAAVFLVACLGYSDLLAYRGATVAQNGLSVDSPARYAS